MILATASLLLAQASDGTILAREPFQNRLPYAEWFRFVYEGGKADDLLDPKPDRAKARAYYTPALYRALDGKADVRVDRLVYASDGLRIRGFELRPRRAKDRLPVIVWLRGGIGGDGAIVTGDLMTMANWARAGYVVLATQYRGGPGSEGHDEDGGKDAHDVVALFETVRRLPEADASSLFLYGESRGGMMAHQALASGVPIRAAVVNSGVADFVPSGKPRPDAAEMEALARAAIPDYEWEKAAGFPSRSAVRWPERIGAPVLILHGTADWRVDPGQALRMAAALQGAGKPYELLMVEGGTHVALDRDPARLDRLVLDFFARHRATPSGRVPRP